MSQAGTHFYGMLKSVMYSNMHGIYMGLLQYVFLHKLILT